MNFYNEFEDVYQELQLIAALMDLNYWTHCFISIDTSLGIEA